MSVRLPSKWYLFHVSQLDAGETGLLSNPCQRVRTISSLQFLFYTSGMVGKISRDLL
jgi:hypothetical protein